MQTARERLEQVYVEDGAKLWRALVGYAADRAIADDALAEAFAQALARGDELREPRAWVWKTAFRVAAGELQRRRREPPAVREDTYEFPQPLDHVIAALRQISPNQRLAVVLHDYADRPTEEIASILGITRTTVHVHLHQGRKRLRKLLEETDD